MAVSLCCNYVCPLITARMAVVRPEYRHSGWVQAMPKEARSPYSELGPYLTMGTQLALGMVAFGGIGYYADGRLGTSPWLMLAGLIFGATGGMIKLIRTATAAERRGKKRNPDN